MAGVAVVLAVYRGFTDWSEFRPEELAGIRRMHLAFGLAYGVALGGFGLLVWRRITGGFPFPSQPGHWLLVLVALGFAVDGVTLQVVKLTQRAGWVPEGREPRYYLHLTLIWFSVLAGTLFAMLRWTKMGRWRWLAVAAALLALANGVSHLVAEFFFYSALRPAFPFSGGNWPYFVAMWSRASGAALCLPLLWLIAYADRRGRDWLHWAGVAAASMLGLVEFVQVLVALIRYS
jgi:hypothetical protein